MSLYSCKLLKLLGRRVRLYKLPEVLGNEVEIALGDPDGTVPHRLAHEVDRLSVGEPAGDPGVPEIVLPHLTREPGAFERPFEAVAETVDTAPRWARAADVTP